MKIDNTKKVSDLTVAELKELLNCKEDKKYEYGLKGLAKLLGCSRSKASEIKSSGILNEAISQNGNLILIEKEKALELFKKNSDKQKS